MCALYPVRCAVQDVLPPGVLNVVSGDAVAGAALAASNRYTVLCCSFDVLLCNFAVLCCDLGFDVMLCDVM
jgi:hypothetical protein